MSSNYLSHPSSKTRPKLHIINTDQGKLYRVMYAGMVKEHCQEWQARCFYEQMMDMWRMRHCHQPGTRRLMDM